MTKSFFIKICQISFFLFLFLLLHLSFPAFQYAADCTNAPVCGDDNCPATLACVTTSVIPNVIYTAFILVGITTVVMIVMAGIKFIFSGGDNKQLEGAKKTLTFAIIGLTIVIFSYFIIQIIAQVTGVHCIADFQHLSFTTCK